MSVNDFVIRAAALALAEVPEANALWDSAAQVRPGLHACFDRWHTAGSDNY